MFLSSKWAKWTKTIRLSCSLQSCARRVSVIFFATVFYVSVKINPWNSLMGKRKGKFLWANFKLCIQVKPGRIDRSNFNITVSLRRQSQILQIAKKENSCSVRTDKWNTNLTLSQFFNNLAGLRCSNVRVLPLKPRVSLIINCAYVFLICTVGVGIKYCILAARTLGSIWISEE